MSINPEHTGESHIAIDGNETVKCIRLDDYVRDHQVSRIDLMKLDVEGFELTALKGMSESLQRGVVKCLYFEFMKKWLARHGDPLELLNFLNHCGFEIFYCRPHDLENFSTPSAKHEVIIGNHKLRLARVDASQTPEHTDLLAIHSSLLGPTT
jgi:hypothetical protein